MLTNSQAEVTEIALIIAPLQNVLRCEVSTQRDKWKNNRQSSGSAFAHNGPTVSIDLRRLLSDPGLLTGFEGAQAARHTPDRRQTRPQP
jgi:hypothetical protein